MDIQEVINMKAKTMSHVLRGLAVASLMTLAACQVPPNMADNQAAAGTAAARPAAAQQQGAANSSAPAITFHLAQANPAQGLARIQLNPQTSLYALPQPVFTQADLQQIVPVQTKSGQVYLRFDFTQQGAAKLAQVTRQAVGNYLILSAHGKLVAVPRIGAAYTDGRFPVPVKNADEARAMLQTLRDQPAAPAK